MIQRRSQGETEPEGIFNLASVSLGPILNQLGFAEMEAALFKERTGPILSSSQSCPFSLWKTAAVKESSWS